MPDDSKNVKIRVKSGDSEAEIETSLSSIHEAIELIPEILAKLPQPSVERRLASVSSPHETMQSRPPATTGVTMSIPAAAGSMAATISPSSTPTVTIEKGDSLSDVISKFFADSWGRSPRKLMEVREALQSYGLNYPKQSVAVALLRLAKSSKIRRFKGEGGEYVYTASTGAVRISAPVQSVTAQPAVEESERESEQESSTAEAVASSSSPSLETGQEQEEQLNLDAPSAN